MNKKGFTLVEIMVAMLILVTAMTLVGSTFNMTISAWRKGTSLSDSLHRGDFLMEQIVSALRSTAWLSEDGSCGFRMEVSGSDTQPEDIISWVASGTSLIPIDSELGSGLHRIEMGVNLADANGLAVRSFSHLLPEEDWEDIEWELIDPEVEGFRCRFYDYEEEEWADEWEHTNVVPKLVEIALFMSPLEGDDEPMVMQRLIEIPLGLENPQDPPSTDWSPAADSSSSNSRTGSSRTGNNRDRGNNTNRGSDNSSTNGRSNNSRTTQNRDGRQNARDLNSRTNVQRGRNR